MANVERIALKAPKRVGKLLRISRDRNYLPVRPHIKTLKSTTPRVTISFGTELGAKDLRGGCTMTPRISHASNGYDEGSIKFDWCKNMSDHVRPCVWGHLRTQSSNDLVSFLAEDVTKRSESAPPPSSQRTMTATEDGRVLLFQSDFDRVPSFASHDPLHLAHCLAARKLCSTLASMDSQDHDSESNLEQHSAAWVPGRVPIRFENVTNSVAISSPSNFEDDINFTHQRNHAVACVGQVPSNTGTGSASTYHTIFTTSSGSTGTNTTAPKGLGLVHRHAAAETVTRAGNEAIVSLSPGGGKRREQKKQQHLEVTKVIRPNPVKTAPPGAAATRFAALPISGHDDNLRAEPKGSGILHADGPSVPLFSSPNHSEYSRGEGTGKTQLSEEAKEAAVTIPRQGSVLQEWQTTFPDNQVRAMAPSRMAVMDGNFVPRVTRWTTIRDGTWMGQARPATIDLLSVEGLPVVRRTSSKLYLLLLCLKD